MMKEDRIYFVDSSNNLEPVEKNRNVNTVGMDTISSSPVDSPINQDTGEINWDCPCLKSALEPPCGEFFKAAFSCFVASTTEPKGSDCLDKFAAMQDCFRAHPEIYLKDDDDEDEDNLTPPLVTEMNPALNE